MAWTGRILVVVMLLWGCKAVQTSDVSSVPQTSADYNSNDILDLLVAVQASVANTLGTLEVAANQTQEASASERGEGNGGGAPQLPEQDELELLSSANNDQRDSGSVEERLTVLIARLQTIQPAVYRALLNSGSDMAQILFSDTQRLAGVIDMNDRLWPANQNQFGQGERAFALTGDQDDDKGQDGKDQNGKDQDGKQQQQFDTSKLDIVDVGSLLKELESIQTQASSLARQAEAAELAKARQERAEQMQRLATQAREYEGKAANARWRVSAAINEYNRWVNKNNEYVRLWNAGHDYATASWGNNGNQTFHINNTLIPKCRSYQREARRDQSSAEYDRDRYTRLAKEKWEAYNRLRNQN